MDSMWCVFCFFATEITLRSPSIYQLWKLTGYAVQRDVNIVKGLGCATLG